MCLLPAPLAGHTGNDTEWSLTESSQGRPPWLQYMQEVLVYLDPDDESCRAAVRFLQAHAIGFTIRDTAADPEALRELRYMGAERLPTIIVNGVAVEGFDEETLREVLGLGS